MNKKVIAWLPLICGSLLVVVGGFFVSLEIGWHAGLGWEIGWTLVQFVLGCLVGWHGTMHALNHRSAR